MRGDGDSLRLPLEAERKSSSPSSAAAAGPSSCQGGIASAATSAAMQGPHRMRHASTPAVCAPHCNCTPMGNEHERKVLNIACAAMAIHAGQQSHAPDHADSYMLQAHRVLLMRSSLFYTRLIISRYWLTGMLTPVANTDLLGYCAMHFRCKRLKCHLMQSRTRDYDTLITRR